MNPEGDEALRRFVEAVADRTPVDWEREGAAHPGLQPRLRRLRILEAVAALGSEAAADPLIATRLSHFQIVERIGQGGMGVVYRAEDERLLRSVALKLLPPELVGNEERRQRLLREARSAAALSHPNIAAIHEVDEAEGVVFIAMELVEGRTLREVMDGRPLSIRDALRIAAEMAEGLAHAHQARVIHRDLKPDNVMIRTDRHVKILDFGLAKPVEEPPAAGSPEGGKLKTISGEVSRAGEVLGTPAYMSPEQARGATLDTRSDIFAFGSTLYEMVTGKVPFQGRTPADTLSAILREEPAPAPQLNPGVPEGLGEIISKCLEKDPDERYQDARDLVVDLRRLQRVMDSRVQGRRLLDTRTGRIALVAVLGAALAGALVVQNLGGWRERLLGGSGPSRIDSLAVLPLENLSGDPEQEYFADGMTDALITNLAQIRSIRVISRTSVMRYKRTLKPLAEIARELNVKAIVEGSVMRSGDRVRITSQLVETATDRHVWARSYERDLRDVLGLQSEVAGAIAEEIQATLTPQEKERLARSRPVSPGAYEAYLRGRYYWNQRTTEAVRKGIGFFEEAIAKDPTYAPAYAGLADSYLVIGRPNLNPRESYGIARQAALKALELDPELAEAYPSLGVISIGLGWNLSEAERNYRRAIELNPNYATAHHWYAIELSLWGRHEEALREMEKARELDPLSLIIHADFGIIYYNARQYDKAIEYCLRALEMEPPGYPAARRRLGLAYHGKGMYEKAVRELEQAIPSLGRVDFLGDLGHAYARAGKRAEAMKVLDEMEHLSKVQYVSPMNRALVYLGLGRTDEALKWLSLAVEERDFRVEELGTDSRLDPLRTDTRFAHLLRRVGLWPD